jgi:putative hydrolases of HD superfamily
VELVQQQHGVILTGLGPARTFAVPDRTVQNRDMDDRLTAQLRFVLEADRLKHVERRSFLADGSRRENSAEHSWHLALMALALAEHADEPVDRLRVLTMLVLHDLVEIDAGDAFVYDLEARAAKHEAEQRAAQRLFGILPEDQARELRALWTEYEDGATADARFARSLDRLQPLVLNHASGGATWREHDITAEQVLGVNESIASGSAALWSRAQDLIADSVARGYLADSAH